MMRSFYQIFSRSYLIIPVLAGLEIVTSLSFYKVDQFSLLFHSASEHFSFAVVFFFKSLFHPFYLHLRICCYLLDPDFYILSALPHFLCYYDVAYYFWGVLLQNFEQESRVIQIIFFKENFQTYPEMRIL